MEANSRPLMHHKTRGYEDYTSDAALPTPPLDTGSTHRSCNIGNDVTQPSQRVTLSRLLNDNKQLLGKPSNCSR